MNIFILDLNIEKCAQYHCDQHVVKMILESAQIACTALNEKGFETPYRSTHVKHPCVLWAGESYDNLEWLKKLANALNEEYRFRFETSADHKSLAVIKAVDDMRFESKGLTEFPQAMPEKYRVPGDPVKAYRQFYVGEKLGFARWTRRKPPSWINEIRRK
ncbi:MAG: pyrimidine dimer DNA glycosylase/endonuclease V [Candidatus Marinimicrobia bacterium]|nr:pyrimidine dimer DNA glycosylase/endonuclease V [Candidatus Neomarinimicrobiota bacterium]